MTHDSLTHKSWDLCLYTTTFTLLIIFSPLEMIGIKIWETSLSCHAKGSPPFAVRVSKTRMLKLPINCQDPMTRREQLNNEFKQRRRLRLRQRHKARIVLVKKRKTFVLHVQHGFPCISFRTPQNNNLNSPYFRF